MSRKLARHNLIVLWLVLGISASFACDLGVQVPAVISSPTPTLTLFECQDATDPTEEDIAYALGFTGDVFETNGWQRRYTVQTMRTSVIWTNDQEEAVVDLEYLLYSCGYTQADVDEYFSDQNLREFLFQSYQDLEQVTSCSQDKAELTLYEFSAKFQGRNYVLRLWIAPVDQARLLYVVFVFPETSVALLDRYAQEVFPALSSCARTTAPARRDSARE